MFGDIAQVQFPTVTSAQNASGRVVKSWSYDSSDSIPCRFFESSAREIARQEGQALVVEATLHCEYSQYTLEPEATTDEATGERRQVRIKKTPTSDWVLWEVVGEKDLGMQARKELSLRRWKR